MDVAASAAVNADGRLEPVEHLETKCLALREQWPAVRTIVVAAGQTAVPAVEGLRIVKLADLDEALKEFGLDLERLPSPSVDELEKRLTALEVEEREQHSSSQWLARAIDAWEIGKRLRTERNSKWPRAQILAGLMASHAGDQELAVSMLDSADDTLIRKLPLRARKQLVLASCTIDRQPERALAAATAALELATALEDEDHEELFGLASGTLGRVLMHRGDLEAAEPTLRAAYEHHRRVAPHEACRSACYLACCLRLMGRSEAAVELASLALAEAQSLQDQFDAAKTTIAFARLERGRALEALGRYAEAAVELEQVVAINRSAESYPRLGAERSLASVFRAASKLDEARAHLVVCKRVARGDAPLTLRKVGAVAAAEELRSAHRAGRPTMLPHRDLQDAWDACFGDAKVDDVLRTWIY
jgi:tetratricopeptide (TPR) repeat protein